MGSPAERAKLVARSDEVNAGGCVVGANMDKRLLYTLGDQGTVRGWGLGGGGGTGLGGFSCT